MFFIRKVQSAQDHKVCDRLHHTNDMIASGVSEQRIILSIVKKRALIVIKLKTVI